MHSHTTCNDQPHPRLLTHGRSSRPTCLSSSPSRYSALSSRPGRCAHRSDMPNKLANKFGDQPFAFRTCLTDERRSNVDAPRSTKGTGLAAASSAARMPPPPSLALVLGPGRSPSARRTAPSAWGVEEVEELPSTPPASTAQSTPEWRPKFSPNRVGDSGDGGALKLSFHRPTGVGITLRQSREDVSVEDPLEQLRKRRRAASIVPRPDTPPDEGAGRRRWCWCCPGSARAAPDVVVDTPVQLFSPTPSEPPAAYLDAHGTT